MKQRMFVAVLGIALVSASLSATPAHSDDNVDACGVVLCLAGLMSGGSGSKQCSEYEASYFSIVRFHNGHFDLSGTSGARGQFLDECQSVGGDLKGSVNSQYGGVESGP